MKLRSLGYCLVQGMKNIGRNRIFSFASVATISLCIFILGLFYAISSNVNYMVNNMSDNLCIKIFFDYGITDERIESIGNTIREMDGVTDIHYTSKEEAWEQFKEEYFGEEYKDLADGFENDNPLANSASYEIYYDDAGTQGRLVEQIKVIDGVRKINTSESAANGLDEMNTLVKIVSIAVFAVLLAIALFLINNTISIGISVRNEEIGIMRLLGARNGFIRAPFIVEGMVIGTVGAIIPILIIYFAYEKLITYIMNNFSILDRLLTFQPASDINAVFIPVALVLGLGLGLIGSIMSVGKHLKA